MDRGTRRLVRLGLADPTTVEDELPDVSDLDRVARAYRTQLAEHEVVDFDEQVTGAIERLLGDPVFRLRTQRFARVLLVDEFQTSHRRTCSSIRLLTGPAGAVFGVGDDDQTIYGYAGATPRWLVDFGDWFPGAAMHSLEVNYRCPAPVVAAASNLLTRNALRVEKVIRVAPSTVTQPSGPEHLFDPLGRRRPGDPGLQSSAGPARWGRHTCRRCGPGAGQRLAGPRASPSSQQRGTGRRGREPAVSSTRWRSVRPGVADGRDGPRWGASGSGAAGGRPAPSAA